MKILKKINYILTIVVNIVFVGSFIKGAVLEAYKSFEKKNAPKYGADVFGIEIDDPIIEDEELSDYERFVFKKK